MLATELTHNKHTNLFFRTYFNNCTKPLTNWHILSLYRKQLIISKHQWLMFIPEAPSINFLTDFAVLTTEVTNLMGTEYVCL